MRNPGGVHVNQAIFVVVNIWLVIGWATQIKEEKRLERAERIKALREQVEKMEELIGEMEEVLVVSLSTFPLAVLRLDVY